METNEQQGILFDAIDVEFELPDQAGVASWLEQLAINENRNIEILQYIFCSDEYLIEINKEYLDHDDYTDIITFPYSVNPIRSDIFISIDRIIENALKFEVSFDQELNRVMAHGLLHLCGFLDKTEDQKKIMRKKEDLYIKERTKKVIN